ncbi:MAG: protein kinase [Pirellulales bacterium]
MSPSTDDARRALADADTAVTPQPQPNVNPGSWPCNVDEVRLVDHLCDEFESRWHARSRPRIEDYLVRCPTDLHGRLLNELLALELDYRLSLREDLVCQEYVSRFRDLAEVVQSVFDSHPSSQTDWALAPMILTSPLPERAEKVPSQVGKYQLLQELGRGGMGVVYKARQSGLGRIVAVKMLLAGHHADRHDLYRFRAEAEAVASLQHPNIVQVFEVGEYAGQPFLSLEFVPGGHLGQRIAGEPQPARAAAELVACLATAIQHAHDKGIIHRDLKPANILLADEESHDTAVKGLGARPLKPKVSDFGLAKRLESDEHTRSGTVIGTASYMSPEQARGETSRLGAATDIYALGAILYELITGRPPFRGETPWDTVAQVIADDPVPPTRLQPKAPRDLETICLKCLHKDPARRYESAADLADDLQRFLDGKPIVARPIRLAGRAWKWACRRPVVAALLSALAAVVLLGLASTTLMWRLAEQRREMADDTSRKARAAIREHFVLATENAAFQGDGMQRPRQLLLDKALVFFQDFAASRQDDRALQAEVADAHQRVGRILVERGSLAEAAANFQQAIVIYQQLQGERPNELGLQTQQAAVLTRLARVNIRQGDIVQASKHQRASDVIREKVARDFPADIDFQVERARSRMEAGFLFYEQRKFDEALTALQSARELVAKLQLKAPGGRVDGLLADCLIGIGHNHWAAGRPGEAVPVYRQAVELREELLPKSPTPDDRSELARAYGSLGQAQEDLGEFDNALQSFQRSLALRQTLVDKNADVPEFRAELALSCKNVADELVRRGQFAEAFELRKRLVGQLEQCVAMSPHNVHFSHMLALGHLGLAELYRRDKKLPDLAAQQAQAGMAIWEQLVKAEPVHSRHLMGLAQGYGEIAMQHLVAQEFSKAIDGYGRSNELLDRLLAIQPNDVDAASELSRNYVNMAYCHEMSRQNADGLRLAAKSWLLRDQLARRFPQRPRYQESLDKVSTDLAGAATIYMNLLLPLPKGVDIAEQRKIQHDRVRAWKKWAEEFPQIQLFQQRIAECEATIDSLQLQSSGCP